MTLPDPLTFDVMNSHLGTVFQAEAGDRTVDLHLVEARKVMESEAARLARHPFSLFFSGPETPFLPQKTYRLHHAAFGEPLDIFLVPVERKSGGYLYEAVFT